jgi:hypothetical protein
LRVIGGRELEKCPRKKRIHKKRLSGIVGIEEERKCDKGKGKIVHRLQTKHIRVFPSYEQMAKLCNSRRRINVQFGYMCIWAAFGLIGM